MTSPIQLNEFKAVLGRHLPASRRVIIAVANSAGPDSTCLLFLLRQLLPPSRLLSLHVHHHLQPAAHAMAALAAHNAAALAVPHRVLHVPWGEHPFPPAPAPAALERTARDARYHLLFRALVRARAPLLALGHHADDQLETAILRLASRSSPDGAAGMRPLRRWGMGTPRAPLADFGHRGLDAFILRPLLPFPKTRIIATCHAHQLRYINDPTNSQPHITSRNAVRHCLAQRPPFSQPIPFPPSPFVSFHTARDAFLGLLAIPSPSRHQHQRLYAALTHLASTAEHLQRKASLLLANARLPSPTGTLLLSSADLLHATDPDLRAALVLRVLRFVSFHPWGSLRADADRRQSSIHRIVRALWPLDPLRSNTRSFTAGAGVLWSPAIFNPNKTLRVGDHCLNATLQPDDRFAWLASRLPPFVKNPQQGAGDATHLVIDLTDQLKAAASPDPLEILYDSRFLLRIHPCQIPSHVKLALHDSASIKVLPLPPYYSPKVVLQHGSHPDRVLALPDESNESSPSPWISIRWIRPLDAV